jgi:uncharacterized protein YgiM (DUF1202 family)
LIRRALLAALAAWPMASSAETLYVSDRLVIGLRSDITDNATIVRSVETGTVLEVLERHGTRARVRSADGVEGWVEERYLSAQPPIRARVAELEGEIKRLRAAAARAPAKDDTAAKLAQLETALAATHAELTQAKSDAGQARQALAAAQRDAAARPPAPAPEPGLSPALWLLIGFAMLGVGFIAGMIWVRESIRRRMGGMYLRI